MAYRMAPMSMSLSDPEAFHNHDRGLILDPSRRLSRCALTLFLLFRPFLLFSLLRHAEITYC